MVEYTWLQEYERTWEQTTSKVQKTQHQIPQQIHMRPLLRHTVLVLDYSKSSLKSQSGHRKYKTISDSVREFKSLYYTFNPLSKLTVIISKDSQVFLQQNLSINPSGQFSLQNSLQLANKLLQKRGAYWSSEILVIQTSLSTCDPQNIWQTVQKLQHNMIRVCVFSLTARMSLLQQLSRRTGGFFSIVTDLRASLQEFAQSGIPAQCASLVKMGFPSVSVQISPCACHLEMHQGFICPVCGAKVCKLPVECPVCRFTLVTTPHLAKAKLSLTPLESFVKSEGIVCMICRDEGVLQCPRCFAGYCKVCEKFVRSSLGKCVACSVV